MPHTGDETCALCYGPRWAAPGERLPEIICYRPDAVPIPESDDLGPSHE